MKHATTSGLGRIEQLLTEIRTFKGLREKSPGVFYFRTKAFLHFHEDPAGIFADLRAVSNWERMPVNAKNEQARLLRKIRTFVVAHASSQRRDTTQL